MAELLRDKADLFTFNHLAMIAEGAALASAELKEYQDILERFVRAVALNSINSLKDNFCNLHLYREGEALSGRLCRLWL